MTPPLGAGGPEVAMLAPLLGGHPGRIPDVFEALAPLLADRGVAVVAASDRSGRLARAVDMVRTLRRHRRTLRVVVIHLYSGRAFVVESLLARVARRQGLALVGVLAGGGFPSFAARHRRWVDGVLGRFDLLVGPSEYLAGWASDRGHPAVAIPNPLDPASLPFRRRDAVEPRLFWMRAFHEIYRPETAVRVLAKVRERLPTATLTMAGPDKGAVGSTAELVADLGLEDAVELLGFVGPDAKRALFGSHDVFLNTPRLDNRPVCLVEAGAGGLVIVSTDAGGIPDLVTDGVDALLAPVDDVDGLADRVIRVVGDPALAGRLSEGGRRMAGRGEPARVADAWEQVLSEVRAHSR